MRLPEADAGLVPFVERLRGLQLARVALALAVVAAAATGSVAHLPALPVVVALAAGYLLLTAPTLLVTRLRRSRAIVASGAALLVDGLFLALTSYGPAGFASPMVGLVMLHTVGVTLVSSFRTGLKIAAWHTLLVMATHQLQADGLLPTPPGSGSGVVVVVVAFLWLVAIATASFAAVNEREIRRRNYDLVALTRFSLQLEGSLRPLDVGGALLSAVCDDQGVHRAILLSATGGRLERLVGRGDTPVPDLELDPGADHMVARAIVEHRTLRVPALAPERDPWLSAALPGARNVMLVPVYADGAVAGVLAAEHPSSRGSRVEARVLAMLEHYASHAALALTNARLLTQMRQLAETDGLTGVGNRRTFDRVLDEDLASAGRQGRPLSLVLVDLDHFKALNDTFGHQEGDAVLRGVAAALMSVCRPSDYVARYGGEEFAVVLPGAGAAAATAFAERLRAAVATVRVGGADVHVTASVGVAVCEDGGAGAAALIGVADGALYRSKREGRDRGTVEAVRPGGSLAAPGAVALPAQAGPEQRALRDVGGHGAPDGSPPPVAGRSVPGGP